MLSVRSRISSTLKVCRMRVIDASIGRAAADYVFHTGMALINQGRHPVREEALINQASCGSQGACVCLYLLVDTVCHVLLYIHTYLPGTRINRGFLLYLQLIAVSYNIYTWYVCTKIYHRILWPIHSS